MTNTKTRSRRKFTAEFKAKVAMEEPAERAKHKRFQGTRRGFARASDTRHLRAAISSKKRRLDA